MGRLGDALMYANLRNAVSPHPRRHITHCATSRRAVVASRDARPEANRTQFLFAAFASYIAVSAQAMSCCGEEACFGNVATPKLAVNESCKRRPPVK